MSHSHVTHLCHESFTCDSSVTWVMHMWLICVRHESCRTHQVTDTNVTYMNVDTDMNVDICDMMCTTWVIHMCKMARVSVARVSFIDMNETRAMTRHRYEWDSSYDTTQIWMRLELCSSLSSSSRVSCHQVQQQRTWAHFWYNWVVSRIWMPHIPHTNQSLRRYAWDSSHIHEWVMSHIWMSHVTRCGAWQQRLRAHFPHIFTHIQLYIHT